MTQCFWIPFCFSYHTNNFFTDISVLYILFGKDQDKTDLQKEETEKIDAKLKAINREPSEQSNLELTITPKEVIPNVKSPQRLEDIARWQPLEMLERKSSAIGQLGQTGYCVYIVKVQLLNGGLYAKIEMKILFSVVLE